MRLRDLDLRRLESRRRWTRSWPKSPRSSEGSTDPLNQSVRSTDLSNTPSQLEDFTALGRTLRSFLLAKLPDYMVPAAYVALAAPAADPQRQAGSPGAAGTEDDAYARAAYEPPRGEVEETLAAIWAELLGVDQISRHDNFFELGGHSLLAIQLLERLRRRNLSIEVRALFATPTLSDLAASLGGYSEVIAPANLITPDSRRLTPRCCR